MKQKKKVQSTTTEPARSRSTKATEGTAERPATAGALLTGCPLDGAGAGGTAASSTPKAQEVPAPCGIGRLGIRAPLPCGAGGEALEAAFTAICQKWEGHVRGALFRLGVLEPDIDDAHVNVEMRLHRWMQRSGRPEEPKNLLNELCGKEVLLYRRTARRRLPTVPEDEVGAMPESRRDPEHDAIDAERRALLPRALDAMAPRDRTLLQRIDLGTETPTDVAKALGLNVNTLQSRLNRARVELKELVRALATEADRERRPGAKKDQKV